MSAASLCGNTAEYMLPFFSGYYTSANDFGTCSGHGECFSGLACLCEDGWTGLSDFVNTEGITCDINELAIKVLWGFNIFALFLYGFITRGALAAKRAQHLDLVASKAAQGLTYGLSDNKGYAAVLVFALGCLPSTVVMGVVRIALPEERVGMTAIATILFAVCKFFFYLCAYLFQPQLLATILKGSKVQKTVVSLAKTWGKANLILSVGLGFLPFITFFASDTGRDEVAQVVYVLYFGGSVLSMATQGVQAFVIQRRFLAIVTAQEQTNKSARTDEIKKKLVAFQHGTKVQASVQGIIYAVFLLYPFMQNKHDYFLPISWLAFPVLYRKMVTSTVTTRRAGDSSTTGSYSKGGSKDDSKDASHSHSHRGPASSVMSSVVAPGITDATVRNFQEKAYSFHEADGGAQSESDDPDYA